MRMDHKVNFQETLTFPEKHTEATAAEGLIEKKSANDGNLRNTVMAYHGTTHHMPCREFVKKQVASRGCGIDSPNTLKNLMDEFNDLTEKMSSLKHTFKEVDSCVIPVKTKLSKSCCTNKVDAINDVCEAKHVILDCIAELSSIKDYLDGNDAHVPKYQTLSNDYVTEDCCEEAEPHLHGQLCGKPIVLAYETSSANLDTPVTGNEIADTSMPKCGEIIEERALSSNTELCNDDLHELGKRNPENQNSSEICESNNRVRTCVTMDRSKRSVRTVFVDESKKRECQRTPEGSLCENRDIRTSSAFRKDNNSFARVSSNGKHCEVRVMRLSTQTKINELNGPRHGSHEFGHVEQAMATSSVDTAECKVSDRKTEHCNGKLRIVEDSGKASKRKQYKNSNWYKCFTKCVQKEFSEDDDEVEEGFSLHSGKSKQRSLHEGWEQRTRVTRATRSAVSRDKDNDSSYTRKVIDNGAMLVSLDDLSLAEKVSNTSLIQKQNEYNVETVPETLRIPEIQPYSSPAPARHTDEQYDPVLRPCGAEAAIRHYDTPRAFHRCKVIANDGARNFVKLYLGWMSQSDIEQALRPNDDELAPVITSCYEGGNSDLNTRRTKSASFIHLDEPCSSFAVHGDNENKLTKSMVWALARIDIFEDGSQSYNVLKTTPLPLGQKVIVSEAKAIRMGEIHRCTNSR